jgi:hypothetical protein
MQAFNAVYYSFSPQVASLIASHAPVRYVMKVVLYPLIGILFIASLIFQVVSINGELAVTLSGIFAAMGIGLVYFGPVAVLAHRFVLIKTGSKWSVLKPLVMVGCVASTLALLIAELTGLAGIMGASGVAVVLTYCLLGAFCTKSMTASLTQHNAKMKINQV